MSAVDRSDDLSAYVPQIVQRQLSRSDTGSPPEPERFEGALLLVDITGFTRLTAAALEGGPAGVEQLSRTFNGYLGRIIDLMLRHGGDILKFAGDAVIALWPAVDVDLPSAARRAVGAGLAVASELGDVEADDGTRLSLKVGVCAGGIWTAHVGGVGGEWLFLPAGPAVGQLSAMPGRLQTGDVICSRDAWSLVADRFVGQPAGDGHVRVARRETAPAAGSVQVPAPHAVRAALRAYVPRVLLSRIDAGQVDWLAERRRTTVAFVNLPDIEHESPDRAALVQSLAADAQRILHRHDGWLKEITLDEKGTTLVAVFGVPPVSHEDDAARAVDAALEIESSFRRLGLAPGIGIGTGVSFSGPIGNNDRRDFALLGSHVNLAARLMQAPAGGVLADAATVAADGEDRHRFERLPSHVLKGLSSPTDVHRVTARAAVGGPTAPMIDRRAELETAAAALEAVIGGVGALVILEGEPGIGKSRFTAEWVHRAHELGVAVYAGAASDLDASTPYSAWRAVFERLVGVTNVTDPAARRSLAVERLRADETALALAPLLAPVLSIDLPDNEVTAQMTGAVRADNTGDLLIQILSREAGRVPTMVVIEDVHWLDSASWALIARARREIPELLFVLTRRPVAEIESDPVAALDAPATSLRLANLSADDAAALAAQRTGAGALTDALARLVHERAAGNPLFVEQLTYALRDAGRIVVDDGVLRSVSGSADVEGPIIPDTVQRVITTRVDQLPPAQAMTIKVASVIGERFAVRTLADIYPLMIEQTALVDALETLVRLDLLARARAAPEPSYEFRHQLTQEVAYNLMPSTQSRALHRRLAEWYERTYAADLSPFHAFLAHHWQAAGEPARAIEYLEIAAAQALRSFANDEAITFLHEALAAAREGSTPIDARRRARWHLQLGEAYVNLSGYREGREQLETGLRLLGRAPPERSLARGTALIGQLARQSSHRIGALGGRRLDDAQREELVAVCRAYERLAEATYYGGETLLPLYASIRILNEAEASGSAPEIARGLAGTGALFGFVPMTGVANSYLRRALDHLEHVDDLTTHEIVRIVAGFHDIGIGNWQRARDQLTRVRGIAHRLGDRRRLLDALGNLAEIEYLRGYFGAGLQIAEELQMHSRARSDRRFEADALAIIVYCTWQLGRTEETTRAAEALNAILDAEPAMHQELRIKHAGLEALFAAGRGDRAAALAASDEALRLTAAVRPTYFATYLGYAAPAEVYLDHASGTGVPNEARSRATEAVARLGRYAGVFSIGRPRHLLLRGSLYWQAGRHTGAAALWRRALATAKDLDMPFEQGLAHRQLARHLPASDADRSGHLEAARAIFEELGAARALSSLSATDSD